MNLSRIPIAIGKIATIPVVFVLLVGFLIAMLPTVGDLPLAGVVFNGLYSFLSYAFTLQPILPVETAIDVLRVVIVVELSIITFRIAIFGVRAYSIVVDIVSGSTD